MCVCPVAFILCFRPPVRPLLPTRRERDGGQFLDWALMSDCPFLKWGGGSGGKAKKDQIHKVAKLGR